MRVFAQMNSWSTYYAAVANQPPSVLIQQAVSRLDRRDSALDLGSGTMRDSEYLLNQPVGFRRVQSVDSSPDALPYAELMRAKHGHRFDHARTPFADFDYGIDRYDLVHANFSLPFHGPIGFESLMGRILASVRISGVFSGVLFGWNDGWRRLSKPYAFHSRQEVKEMFDGFDVSLQEAQFEGALSDNSRKHWHYFRVIAKKRDEL
ncbi:MAG: class I SAM-dependent methyltransferase [Patescibacteria group bacterium]|nr:class I SAM-dependent methyltransferase [Patescibacteria group bacterium]MDE2116477.1 class I SAM-dependent methyltransferase [Patescibacteria group bacterium]